MDINEIMKQAQQMQKQLEKMNDEISATEFEGTASNGLVTVKVNGNNRLASVSIDPEILTKDDKEMIEELIVIAVNDAMDKIDNKKQNSFGSLTGGMNLPRF